MQAGSRALCERFVKRNEMFSTPLCLAYNGFIVGAFTRGNRESVECTVERQDHPFPSTWIRVSLSDELASTF
jgi:hypothetical protein